MNSSKLSQKRPSGKHGPRWTEEEDTMLKELIQSVSAKHWTHISQLLNQCAHGGQLIRKPKQCRERWNNHLNPDLIKGNWTAQEDMQIVFMYNTWGPKWSKICQSVSGRTENSVKNRYMQLMRQQKKIYTTLSMIPNFGIMVPNPMVEQIPSCFNTPYIPFS